MKAHTRQHENTIVKEYRLAGIPPGSFLMGDTTGKGYKQESPAHEVALDGFFIGKYCVTVKDYYDFIIDAGEEFNELWCDFINPCFIVKNGDAFEIWEGADNFPMIQVSFVGAIAYCNWNSLKNGLDPVYCLDNLTADLSKNGFRLPTEAEWEYACGGPHEYVYSLGNAFDPGLFNHKNYAGDKKHLRAARRRIGGFGLHDYSPMPVGTLPPNEFGLYEMLGNVNEWCHDGYGPYTSNRTVNPPGDEKSSFRVIRGGCFLYDVDKIRKSYRHAIHPRAKCMIDGFRIAKNEHHR